MSFNRLVIGSTLVLALLARQAVASPRMVLLNSAGGLLELELDDLSVTALWTLDWTKGIGERFPPRSVEGTYLAGVAFAPDRKDVYLVVPAAAAEAGAAVPFRILRIRLPRWDVVEAEYQVPRALEEPPSVALRSDSGELYVEYLDPQATADAGNRFIGEIRVLDHLHLRELRTLRTEAPADARELPPNGAYPFFSAGTFFLPGTGVAYDNGALIKFDEDRYLVERFDFHEALSEQQAARLSSQFGVHPDTGAPKVAIMPVDAQERWVLARVVGGGEGGGGELFVVADLVDARVLGLLEVPSSVAHILPDGRILVRELILTPQGGQVSRTLVRTSGEVSIFDPRTGSRVYSGGNDLLAGKLDEVSFLCATPSTEMLFFRVVREAHSELVVVTTKDGSARRIAVDFDPDQATRCLFVDGSR